MQRRRGIGIASVVLLTSLVVFTACAPSKRNGVEFGVILSLTGPAATYGQDNLRGLQLAREVLNEKGGINGKKVELDIQDSAGDPAQSVALARRFAADHNVIAILGPTRTGEAVAVAKLLPTLQIPMMSVGSTGDWQSAAGEFNQWTFRSTRTDDIHLIEPLLKTARDRFGVRRIAAIYTANDDWSVSVMKVYEQAIRILGLQLVAKESQMTGDTDRSAQLTKMKNAEPDALIIDTLASDAPTIANQARRLGIRSIFMGTAGFTSPDTWKLAEPGALDGTLLAENFFSGSPRPVVREFVERYHRKYNADPPGYAAYAYDGLLLLAEACRRVNDPHDRRAVCDALGSIQGFDGVLGRLTYHGRGDAEKTPLILQIKNGRYVQIE